MRPSVLLAATAAVVLALTACSSDDESGTADTTLDDLGGAGLPAAGDAEAPARSGLASSASDRAAPESAPAPAAGGGEPSAVTFADHGIGGWRVTADQAVSTFQTDADVASYRLATTWLERHGVLPAPESVRAEEWINALDHGYPDPAGDDVFALHADTGAPWWQAPPGEPQDTTLLRVGVQATRSADRAPASITFVVDTSGSMRTDDRLDTVVDVLTDFVGTLEPDDRVAVVEFATDARTVIDHTGDHDAVADALTGLRADGQTNTGAGLLLGHELAADAHRDGDNSVVVLLADGVANQGVTDPDAIVEAIADVDAPTRIVTHSVGIGLEVYNDALLEAVANDSGGTYAYIDDRTHAQQLFTRDLPVLDPIAHDVKAQVAFDPATVSGWRLVGYENRVIDEDEFRDDEVVGGYVGAGHAVTALYELRLDTEGGAEASGPLGTATVRWADPDTGEVAETETELAAGDGGASFEVAAAMAATAEALRSSSHVVVDLDGVADRLERLGGDQAEQLARFVREAAQAGQAGAGAR